MPPIDPSKLPPNALAAQGIQPQPFPGARITTPLVTTINPRQVGEVQKNSFDAEDHPYKVAKEKLDFKKEQLETQNLPFEQGMALGDPNLTGQDRLKSVPAAQRPLVQLMLSGRYPAISSFGLSRPQLMSVMSTAMAVDPTFDPSLFGPRLQAIKDFTGTGKGATTIGAIEREAGSLRLLKQASDALKNPNVGFGPINKLIAWAQQNTGRKNIDAKQAYELLVDENARQMDRIMKGSGSTSVTGVEELRKDLGNLNASSTRDAAFAAGAGMLGQALQPFKQQWDSAYGGNKAPPMWVTKGAADFLSSLAPDQKALFGGDDYRGLPGLKGDGTSDQATPEGGHPPSYYENQPAFRAPASVSTDLPNGGIDKALNGDQRPITLPEGYQADHDAFLKANPPGTLTPEKYIAFRQAEDKKFNELGIQPIQSQLDPKDIKNFVDGYNNGKLASSIVPTGTVPTNLIEKALVSAPGIFAAKAANAATFGIPDLLSGQEGRDAMDLASKAHPVASTLGEIAGSIAPIAGLSGLAEKGIERLGEGYLAREGFGHTAGQVAGNATYGAVRGFTGSGGDVGSTVEGGGVGALGGVAGHAIGEGANAFIPGSVKSAIADLGDTDLTIPQRLGLGHTEEMTRGVAGMRSGQARAFQSWNKQNVNSILDGLHPDLINGAGIETSVPNSVDAGTGKMQFLHSQLNKGYNTIKPQIGGTVDKDFIENVNNLMPPSGDPKVNLIYGNINDALSHMYSNPTEGGFNGESYVRAQTALRGLAGKLAKAADGDSIDNVTAADQLKNVNAISDELTDLVGRSNPDIFPQLKSLEKAWAQKVQLDDATGRAVAQHGGVFSPANLLQTKKLFSSPSEYASGTAFGQPEVLSAQKVMGSSAVPEKPDLKSTFSIGTGFGTVPAITKAISLIPGSRQTVAAALFKRPDLYKNLPGNLPNLLNTASPVSNSISDLIRNYFTGN